MPTVIEELGELLKQGTKLDVQYRAADMLVTLPVGKKRAQTVKVSTRRVGPGPDYAIRFQSRACPADNPAIVRQAMLRNAGSSVPGLSLDTSVTPHTLDVVYSVVGAGMTLEELVDGLQRVARTADAIEEQVTGGADQF